MIALVFVAFTHAYSLAEGVTPVQKVIQLLEEMTAKGVAEKSAEKKTFVAYSEFCKGETNVKATAIKKAGQQIEMLIADIQMAQSDSRVAAEKIAELNEELAAVNAEKDEHDFEGEKARRAYLKEHADYKGSVDSLDMAIQQLQIGDIPQLLQGAKHGAKANAKRDAKREALLQVQRAAKMPLHAKRVLASFLALHDSQFPDEVGYSDHEIANPLAVSAPEANAYDFSSGGIVDMMKELLIKFKDELAEIEKREIDRKGAHDVQAQDLVGQIEAATEERDRQLATKSTRDTTAGEKKGLLADTKKAKADDEKYLATLNSECQMAAEDFENRQQLRTEELEAIAKATDILKSGSVTGMADKHLPALAQVGFPLLRAQNANAHASVKAVSRFLTGKAAKTGSKLLSLVAQKVASMEKAMGGADPFTKVKKMIQDMIAQLMDQASEEADHNSWCTSELGSNKKTRDSKTDGVNQLTSQKDLLTAEIAKLDEEISSLTSAIAEINKAVAEATVNRQEEKATNEQTIADAKEARAAVAHATAVLKEFYRKAAVATALTQYEAEPKKNPFQKAYKGMGGESGGIVGMLEVIESDFARLQMDTETAEETSDTEFRRFSDASDTDKAGKTQQMKDSTKLRQLKKIALTETVNSLKAMQEELDTALAYYDKLKPSCVDSGLKYEDRVARREAEIKGLQESLQVLEGQDLP
jgi:hypothetical protein